jgi:hypothetical protein
LCRPTVAAVASAFAASPTCSLAASAFATAPLTLAAALALTIPRASFATACRFPDEWRAGIPRYDADMYQIRKHEDAEWNRYRRAVLRGQHVPSLCPPEGQPGWVLFWLPFNHRGVHMG